MSRPVTRSQTAARRAAEAAEAARIRQERESIEAIAAEEVREANSAFRRTSATDVLAYHRQSARAAFINNRRPIALTAQLLNYIDNMRNLPQNALVQPSTSRRRSSRAPSSAQISRLRTIANTRRIMEKKISSIYQISQELYTFLNINQMLYLARNSLTASYYYRKLELTYVIPTIDKFNEICQNIIINIPADVNIARMEYRYDIEYYNQIVNFLQEINQQSLLVSDKPAIKRAIVNDTEHNINNEKEMINDLLNHMREQQTNGTIEDPLIHQEIQRFIGNLETRKRDLIHISKKKLQDYFSATRFQKSRDYSIYVLKSIRTLCKIYMFAIIKLNAIQSHLTSRRSGETTEQRAIRNRHYSETISILYGANVNFTFILNTPITDLAELQLNIVTQSSLLDDIRNSTRLQDIEQYHRELSIRNNRDGNIIDYESLQAELFEPISDADLSTSYRRGDIRRQIQQHRRRDVEMARQVRRAERARLEEMRVAARNARMQAQQEARAARDAERAARASARASSGRQPRQPRQPRQSRPQSQPQSQSVQQITNFDDLMEIDNTVDSEFNNKYVDTIHSTYKDDPNALIFKLKNKVISYSKDFKTNATRQLLFNSFKSKFEKSFDLNAVVVNNPPSIENYVGNSIASLFARFVFNGKHHINFSDLGKYFVINFTLEKNDNPTESDPDEYKRIRQPGIDAGGLRRDFITALTSELFEKKIFISREGTKKYFLNPYFEVDEEFKFIVTSKTGYRFDDEIPALFLKDFYRFIGLLLSFILVNDCGIEHHLSSYLMANFYKTDQSEFDDYDYLYFMFMDFPEYSKSLFNLMADPDTIEYIGTEYNDYYQLTNDENNKTVDKTNIEEYLLLTSKYMMTKTVLRKDIEIPKIHLEIQKIIDKTRQEAIGEPVPVLESEIERRCIEAQKKYIASSDVAKEVKARRDYARANSATGLSPAELTNIGKTAEYKYVIQKSEYITNCLIEGIPDFIKEYFKGPPLYTLKSLNHYLVTPSMSNAIIEKLIRNFTNSMNKRIRQKVGSDKTKHELLTRLFISHILTKKPATAEEDFFKFIDKLLRFWSGSSFYKDNEEYKIQINAGLSNTHLPQSHTCFFLIDLPLYQGSNDDEIGELLYNKLENAVSNVGGGMGFAGGNCRRH